MPSDDPLLATEDAEMRVAGRRIGQLLRARFRIVELLGVGGTAAVYGATDEGGKRVAIKMLHPELSLIPESKQRFLDEAYLANQVGHPGAVTVSSDDVAEDGSVFLVMERLEGEPLDLRLQRTGPMDAVSVLAITDGLLDILAAAHDKGIVHRDIKPGNIFLTKEGGLRLLDFGIARMLDSGRPRWTQAGVAMGTPAFMAPEQARGHSEELDGRSDLWAVGATMFVMLSGRQVHIAPTLSEELLAAMTEPAPALSTVVLFAPREVARIVDQALAFAKERRFADARQMQGEVRKVTTMLRQGTTSIAPRLDLAHTLPGIGEPSVDSTQAVAITRDERTAHRVDGTPQRRGRRLLAAAGLAAGVALGLLLQRHRATRLEAPSGDAAAAAAGVDTSMSLRPPDPAPDLRAATEIAASSLEIERKPPKTAPRGPRQRTSPLRPLARGGDVGLPPPGGGGSLDVDPLGRRK